MNEKYICPMCKVELHEMIGNQLNSIGITLRCENKECAPQLVEGYGAKAKDAYEVVMWKFGRKSNW